MIQVRVFSGEMAAREYAVRHFPFSIGRSAQADLRLEQAGIWDQHLELRYDREQGFSAATMPNALALINGASFQESALRTGDLIEIGALKIRFWLADTTQSNHNLREWLTWTGLGVITLAQIALIYRLIR